MTSVLPSLGAAMAVGSVGVAYAATRRDRKRRERIAAERGPKRKHPNPRYPLSHSSQPSSSLQDTILYSSVGSKNITLVKTGVGIRNTQFWQYYIPESNTMFTSYKALGYHLAR